MRRAAELSMIPRAMAAVWTCSYLGVGAAACAGVEPSPSDITAPAADGGGGAATSGGGLAAAGAGGRDDGAGGGEPWVAESLMIGIASGHPDFMEHPDIESFFESSAGEHHFRMGHMYVPWNVALEESERREELEAWLANAAKIGLEPLIVFNPERGDDDEFASFRPSVAELQEAFDAFRATWPEVHEFMAWNEPNAPVTEVPPERAAEYYLMMSERCGGDCVVAAGNFRGWTQSDFDDLASASGDPDVLQCATAKSYFDRYKCRLDEAAHHRPEHWAFHPYYDSIAYRTTHAHCGEFAKCQTKIFMHQIGGSWADSEVWMTEVGAIHASPDVAASELEQACTGAFLLRLFGKPEWQPRIRRLYYFNWYGYELDMGIVSKAAEHPPREIFGQLRDRVKEYDASCP